jgi:phage tail-like protein
MTQPSLTGMYVQLDPVIGWQATTTNLASTAAGLSVKCVTGQPSPFPASLAVRPGYPVALAHGKRDHRLYLVDDAIDRLQTIDLEQLREFEVIDGFGGKGRQARQFRHPHGVALFEDGSIVIADSGNHQIKIFSGYPYALLSVWGTGVAGSAPGEFNSPWKVVADRCGLTYIADRGNGRVQRIRRSGDSDTSIEGLKNPTGLALGPDGTLAVLDTPNVLLYAPGAVTKPQTFMVDGATCVTLDDQGFLYVGTNTGLIYKYDLGAMTASPLVGIGVTGVAGRFLDLLWTSEAQLVGILLEKCAEQPSLVTIPSCGRYLTAGTLITTTLDSGIEKCQWDRIQLNATIPTGTVVEVTTQTAASDIWADNAPQANATFTPECMVYSATGQNCALVLTGQNPDCLVQSKPGRYLKVQMQIKTNGIVSPLLSGIQISFPRAGYLQYLPAVYQEDDRGRLFLDRFLRIFETTFDNMDRSLDELWKMFDPLSVPSEWFQWLAAWIALPINPLWTDQQRRAALKSAGELYPQRGTPAGVSQLITQYSGVPVRLIEHFRLRQLTILSNGKGSGQTLGSGLRLWSSDYYRRLQVGVYSRVGYFNLTGEPAPDVEPLAWGANQFTVFFDCNPYELSATKKKVLQAVEQEKPAYTQANYAAVFPRFRVGVQSTLGVDTRIGEYTPLLLGTTGTLDYDSILGCSKTETELHVQHATLRPQLNGNLRLM